MRSQAYSSWYVADLGFKSVSAVSKAHVFHPLAGEQAAYFLSHLKATKKMGHITPALPSSQIRLTVPPLHGGHWLSQLGCLV